MIKKILITLLLVPSFVKLNCMGSEGQMPMQQMMKKMTMSQPTESLNIKTVSFQRVLTRLDKSKDAEKEITNDRKGWEDKIKKVETDIKNKVAALEAKAKTAKADVIEKDKEEIEKLQRQGKSIVSEADAVLPKKFNKMMADLQKEIRDKVVSVSQKNGWDLVVVEEAGVLYASDSVRIDDMVVNEMNADYAKEKTAKKPAVAPTQAAVPAAK